LKARKQQRRTFREIDEAYLDFIRRRPCCVCQYDRGCDPHHLKTRATGGSDYTVIPLCRFHHTQIHTWGLSKFEDRNLIDLSTIRDDLLKRYQCRMEK